MESLKHIQTILHGLAKKLNTKTLILIETTGQVLYAKPLDLGNESAALTSLIIGVSAASRQLSAMMGEETAPTLVHEGEGVHLITTEISKDVILALFMENQEKIGFARFKIKQFQPVLKALVDRMKIERKTEKNPLADITEAEVDRLLGF